MRPAVPDPQTAKAIFLAVEKVLAPRRNSRKFPLVDYEDEGDHWTVWRTAPQPKNPIPEPGVLVEVVGDGHQLQLDIAKCDGAISKIWFWQ